MNRIIFCLLFIYSTQANAELGDLFNKKNDLVCITLANGQNCYSRSQAPKEYETKEVKVAGFVLFSLVSHPDKEQIINLLNVKLLAQLEELVILLEFLKKDEGDRTNLVKSKIYQYLGLISQTMDLTIRNASARNYWSSRGPEYINTLKRDTHRAQCLKNDFRRISVNEIEGQKLANDIEFSLNRCGFLDPDYEPSE